MLLATLQGRAPGIRALLIMGALLVISMTARAQYHFNDRCRQAYHEIISLNFTKAVTLLQEERKADPTNLVPLYLENYVGFLQLFIGEEHDVYEKVKKEIDNRLLRLQKGKDSSPYHHFLLGEVYLQWAIARLKFGDVSSAAIEIRKAYAHFEENQEKFPSFLPTKLGLGTIHIIVGLIPSNYRWISSIVGMNGSVALGISELRQVADYVGNDDNIRLYVPEALFYLSFLQSNFHYDKKEALSVLPLFEKQAGLAGVNGSPLLIYAKSVVLMRNGRSLDALVALKSYVPKPDAYPFYFLDYLTGVAQLNNLDLDSYRKLSGFLRHFRGQNYIASAHQRMAWIALLKGDTTGYRQEMAKILTSPPAKVDEDKQAFREAKSRVIPNQVLLKARLLCDGGFYDRALNELLSKPLHDVLISRRDLIEYEYRIARIYHEKGDFQRALTHYRKTIQIGKEEPYYYAAGAALQMGLIHESRQERAQADSAYRICLSINSPEYKSSLHLKARAGLERLNPH